MAVNNREISLRGICRRFTEGQKSKTVLECVDLDVASGESVALRGRSGSGKSTLLNLVAGIDTPDSGTMTVCGRALGALSERDRTVFRRCNLGFVYQSFNLIPSLSVQDNIRLVLDLNRVARPEAVARTAELLHAVGLYERRESYPDVLSGGEQQRVAVARALAPRPGVLLADEPTGNLDDENAEQVMQLLDSLVRQQGTTMLIATHSARVAERCDRVVEMVGGRLQECVAECN